MGGKTSCDEGGRNSDYIQLLGRIGSQKDSQNEERLGIRFLALYQILKAVFQEIQFTNFSNAASKCCGKNLVS